jgi:Zn finger protein HypA/HybF involved in hydrogenase expression
MEYREFAAAHDRYLQPPEIEDVVITCHTCGSDNIAYEVTTPDHHEYLCKQCVRGFVDTIMLEALQFKTLSLDLKVDSL